MKNYRSTTRLTTSSVKASVALLALSAGLSGTSLRMSFAQVEAPPSPPDMNLPLIGDTRSEKYQPLEVFGDYQSRRMGYSGKTKFAGDQVIVQFEDIATKEQISELLSRYGLQAKARIPSLNCYLLSFPGPLEAPFIISLLEKLPIVKFAEPNYVSHLDATPLDSDYMNSQWNLSHIGLPATWDVTKGGAYWIAIFDSGIESGHPDLNSKIARDSVSGKLLGLNYNSLRATARPRLLRPRRIDLGERKC